VPPARFADGRAQLPIRPNAEMDPLRAAEPALAGRETIGSAERRSCTSRPGSRRVSRGRVERGGGAACSPRQRSTTSRRPAWTMEPSRAQTAGLRWIQVQELPRVRKETHGKIERPAPGVERLRSRSERRPIQQRLEANMPNLESSIVKHRCRARAADRAENVNLVGGGGPVRRRARADQNFLWQPVPQARVHARHVERPSHPREQVAGPGAAPDRPLGARIPNAPATQRAWPKRAPSPRRVSRVSTFG